MRSIARSATIANSASLRTDAPNRRRNPARFSVTKRKYAAKPSCTRSRPLAAPSRRGDEARDELRVDVVEQLAVERPLRGEVLVQHRLRDARGLGDLVHRGGVEPALAEHLHCYRNELGPALLRREAHRHAT